MAWRRESQWRLGKRNKKEIQLPRSCWRRATVTLPPSNYTVFGLLFHFFSSFILDTNIYIYVNRKIGGSFVVLIWIWAGLLKNPIWVCLFATCNGGNQIVLMDRLSIHFRHISVVEFQCCCHHHEQMDLSGMYLSMIYSYFSYCWISLHVCNSRPINSIHAPCSTTIPYLATCIYLTYNTTYHQSVTILVPN